MSSEKPDTGEVIDPCPHSFRPCIGRHDCERCRVPEAYGYFLRWEKGKAVWDKRFILEVDRKAILRYYDKEIEKLQKLRAEVENLPSKDDYLKGKI